MCKMTTCTKAMETDRISGAMTNRTTEARSPCRMSPRKRPSPTSRGTERSRPPAGMVGHSTTNLRLTPTSRATRAAARAPMVTTRPAKTVETTTTLCSRTKTREETTQTSSVNSYARSHKAIASHRCKYPFRQFLVKTIRLNY